MFIGAGNSAAAGMPVSIVSLPLSTYSERPRTTGLRRDIQFTLKFSLTFGEEELLFRQVLLTVEKEDGPFVQPGITVRGSGERERLIGHR